MALDKTKVVYQFVKNLFKRHDREQVGDFRGCENFLTKELGVDMIWLNPLYPSPGSRIIGMIFHNFTAVDPIFGDGRF